MNSQNLLPMFEANENLWQRKTLWVNGTHSIVSFSRRKHYGMLCHIARGALQEYRSYTKDSMQKQIEEFKARIIANAI